MSFGEVDLPEGLSDHEDDDKRSRQHGTGNDQCRGIKRGIQDPSTEFRYWSHPVNSSGRALERRTIVSGPLSSLKSVVTFGGRTRDVPVS